MSDQPQLTASDSASMSPRGRVRSESMRKTTQAEDAKLKSIVGSAPPPRTRGQSLIRENSMSVSQQGSPPRQAELGSASGGDATQARSDAALATQQSTPGPSAADTSLATTRGSPSGSFFLPPSRGNRPRGSSLVAENQRFKSPHQPQQQQETPPAAQAAPSQHQQQSASATSREAAPVAVEKTVAVGKAVPPEELQQQGQPPRTDREQHVEPSDVAVRLDLDGPESTQASATNRSQAAQPQQSPLIPPQQPPSSNQPTPLETFLRSGSAGEPQQQQSTAPQQPKPIEFTHSQPVFNVPSAYPEQLRKHQEEQQKQQDAQQAQQQQVQGTPTPSASSQPSSASNHQERRTSGAQPEHQPPSAPASHHNSANPTPSSTVLEPPQTVPPAAASQHTQSSANSSVSQRQQQDQQQLHQQPSHSQLQRPATPPPQQPVQQQPSSSVAQSQQQSLNASQSAAHDRSSSATHSQLQRPATPPPVQPEPQPQPQQQPLQPAPTAVQQQQQQQQQQVQQEARPVQPNETPISAAPVPLSPGRAPPPPSVPRPHVRPTVENGSPEPVMRPPPKSRPTPAMMALRRGGNAVLAGIRFKSAGKDRQARRESESPPEKATTGVSRPLDLSGVSPIAAPGSTEAQNRLRDRRVTTARVLVQVASMEAVTSPHRFPPAAAGGSPQGADTTDEVVIQNVDPTTTTVRRLLQLVLKAINFIPASRGVLRYRVEEQQQTPAGGASPPRADMLLSLYEESLLRDALPTLRHPDGMPAECVLYWMPEPELAPAAAAVATQELQSFSQLQHDRIQLYGSGALSDSRRVSPPRHRDAPAMIGSSTSFAAASPASSLSSTNGFGNATHSIVHDSAFRPVDPFDPRLRQQNPPAGASPGAQLIFERRRAAGGGSLTASRAPVFSPRTSPPRSVEGGSYVASGRRDVSPSRLMGSDSRLGRAAALPISTSRYGYNDTSSASLRATSTSDVLTLSPVRGRRAETSRVSSPLRFSTGGSPSRRSPIVNRDTSYARRSPPRSVVPTAVDIGGSTFVPSSREEEVLANEILALREALRTSPGSAVRRGLL